MSEQSKMPGGLSLPGLPQDTGAPQGTAAQDTGVPQGTGPQGLGRGPRQTYYLMEAANGMLVHIPEDRLESWQAAQDRIRREGYKPDEQLRSKVISMLKGSKGDPH